MQEPSTQGLHCGFTILLGGPLFRTFSALARSDDQRTHSCGAGKGVAKYQALKHTCQACPSKMKCCPKADTSKITREEHEGARQFARDTRLPDR